MLLSPVRAQRAAAGVPAPIADQPGEHQVKPHRQIKALPRATPVVVAGEQRRLVHPEQEVGATLQMPRQPKQQTRVAPAAGVCLLQVKMPVLKNFPDESPAGRYRQNNLRPVLSKPGMKAAIPQKHSEPVPALRWQKPEDSTHRFKKELPRPCRTTLRATGTFLFKKK